MSVDKWRWTEACDAGPCPGDCDLCNRPEEGDGTLYGFTVYDRIHGEPVEYADHYMITPDGYLLKTYRNGRNRLQYEIIRAEGKLLIQHGNGDTEIY